MADLWLSNKNKNQGFTIVEMLIVIVVIAILAIITVVSYNGMTQRANNAVTIDAAKQAIDTVTLYAAEKGTYPATAYRCLTTEQSCKWSTNNAAPDASFQDSLKEYGGLPASVPDSGSTDISGIYYIYGSSWTFDGVSRPAAVIFSLEGTNQDCQLPNTANTGSGTKLPSTSGNSGNTAGGATACVVVIDGPTN